MEKLDPETWVSEYGDFLYRYAYSRLRDANSAEEVVQETLLAGVRYSGQYSGAGTVQGWLTGILKRKIIDLIRARAKHAARGGLDNEHDPSNMLFDAAGNWKTGAIKWEHEAENKLQYDELQKVVQNCLTTLPRSQADVFVLSVMEEMEADEICTALEITPSNMWVRMHRARLGLAKCVGEKWEVEAETQHVR